MKKCDVKVELKNEMVYTETFFCEEKAMAWVKSWNSFNLLESWTMSTIDTKYLKSDAPWQQ